MEVQRFEQAILKMAFETEAKITTATVAYYLGIPSRKANQLLETLLEEGVLELDSDNEGNLYYFVPNHQGQGASLPMEGSSLDMSGVDESWERLEAAADAAARTEKEEKSQVIADGHFSTTIDDLSPSHDEAPLSPSQHSPYEGADGRAGTDFEPPSMTGSPYASPSNHHSDESWTQTQPSSSPSWSRGKSSRFEDISRAISSRMGRPDARLDRCGNASLVVENAAACEPKPLAEARPTVTTCTDVDTHNYSTHHDYGGFGFTAPRSTTALATTSASGEMTLTAENHIEQPEHQPGMALLLSLILSGTGQIYNGEVSKGIIMLILTFLLWFVFLGWVVHIWSIVDAVVVAERINRKSQN